MRQRLDGFFDSWDTLTLNERVRPFFNFRLDNGVDSLEITTTPYAIANPPNPLAYADGGKALLVGMSFPKYTLAGDKLSFSATVATVDNDVLAFILACAQDTVVPDRGTDVAIGELNFYFLNEDGTVHADSDIPLCHGFFDTCVITESAETSIATITFATSANWLHDTPMGYRYTDAIQRARFATDTGFSRVESLQSWTGEWIGKPKKNIHKKHQSHKRKDKTT